MTPLDGRTRAGVKPLNPGGRSSDKDAKVEEQCGGDIDPKDVAENPRAPYGSHQEATGTPLQGYPVPGDWNPGCSSSANAYPGDNFAGGPGMGRPLPSFVGEPKRFKVAGKTIHGYLVSQDEMPNGDVRRVYQEHLSHGIVRQTTVVDKSNRVSDNDKAGLGILGLCLVCCCCCPEPW